MGTKKTAKQLNLKKSRTDRSIELPKGFHQTVVWLNANFGVSAYQMSSYFFSTKGCIESILDKYGTTSKAEADKIYLELSRRVLEDSSRGKKLRIISEETGAPLYVVYDIITSKMSSTIKTADANAKRSRAKKSDTEQQVLT